MGDFFSRFLSFDKLIATSLIKLLYWLGLIGVAIMTVGLIIGALGSFQLNFMAGLGGLIGAPIVGLASLIFWRFICEVYLVIFGIYDRLGDIQKALGGGQPASMPGTGETPDAPKV